MKNKQTSNGKLIQKTEVFKKTIAELLQSEAKRKEAEEKLKKAKDELEMQAWGLQKANEGIKILYKELEDKNRTLQKLDQLKSDFVSTVTHELRSPLVTIRESIVQVLDGIFGKITQKQRKFLGISLHNVDRLAQIINELLDIAKIEAGKVTAHRELIDIVGLAREVSTSFCSRAANKNLEIRVVSAQKEIGIYVDKDRITQVFTNLVDNALKFTEKGHIEISVVDREGIVECSVSDTGRGIAEDDLPQVFSKFQQFGRSAGSGRGTGLGLSIVKGLVELHRGNMRVESTLHRGTTFTFALPKLNREDVIHEVIENELEKAIKGNSEFLVTIIKLDKYAQLQQEVREEKAHETLLTIAESLKRTLRGRDSVMLRSKEEIVVIAGISRENMPRVTARLRGIIKEALYGVDKKCMDDFFYGNAVYPDDADNALDLLKKAETSLISEREERLKKNIMIVDDEPLVIRSLKRVLKGFGYSNFTEAASGNEVLQKLKAAFPDLIILDMKMPEMSGYDVIERLKEERETKNIPIVIMSGYTLETDRLQPYTGKKAIPTIDKTFDRKELEKVVKNLL